MIESGVEKSLTGFQDGFETSRHTKVSTKDITKTLCCFCNRELYPFLS